MTRMTTVTIGYLSSIYFAKNNTIAYYSACPYGGVLNSPRFCFFTPSARRAWRSYKFAGFCFFFGCRKLGYRSWVIPLCILLSEPASPRLLNSISSKLCHQNTQFNMYTTTSKQQEGSTCKDSYPNCFIAKKFYRETLARSDEHFESVFRHFRLCFHFPLKFVHIDQTHSTSTETSEQNTHFNM